MHPPCEMMVDTFLPAMREMVARKLSAQGYSQGRIAGMLGVTQASVSLYLRKGRGGGSERLLSRLGVGEEEGERYALLLAEDLKKDPVYAVTTLYSVWTDLLSRGALCTPHRSAYPSLARCEVCMKVFGTGRAAGSKRSEEAIDQVAEAVRMVEASPAFVRVMPEVSVNIAYSSAEAAATSIQDVVAVPGRIVKVKGMPRSFMRPEYGASTHVASVLLVAMSHDRGRRAAMNLRYDERMERVLDASGLRRMALEESPGRTDPEMLEAFARMLARSGGPIDALVEKGGAGLEPGIYVFARDAIAVAALGLRLARAYGEEEEEGSTARSD